MKQSLLVAFLIAFTGWAKGQHFVCTPSQHMSDTVEAGEFRSFHMDIASSDSSDITLKWLRVSNTLGDNFWSYSLCDYPNCYPGVPASGQMNTVTTADMQNGTTAFFQLAVATHDSAGDGKVEIYVYEANDISKGDTISFHLVTVEQPEDTSGTTGMETVAGAATAIFPNPTAGMLTVESKGLESVMLYDITGHLVFSRQGSLAGKETFDLSSVVPGAYTLAVSSSRGLHMERLIKL